MSTLYKKDLAGWMQGRSCEGRRKWAEHKLKTLISRNLSVHFQLTLKKGGKLQALEWADSVKLG